jgi:hypothetical protein
MLRAVHVYKGILFLIIDKLCLGIFIRNIEILHVVAAEPKVNETYEGASRCDEEDAGQDIYVSGSIANELEEWAVLVLK